MKYICQRSGRLIGSLVLLVMFISILTAVNSSNAANCAGGLPEVVCGCADCNRRECPEDQFGGHCLDCALPTDCHDPCSSAPVCPVADHGGGRTICRDCFDNTARCDNGFWTSHCGGCTRCCVHQATHLGNCHCGAPNARLNSGVCTTCNGLGCNGTRLNGHVCNSFSHCTHCYCPIDGT